jgi:cation diffusion facilitator family transporter
MPTADADRGRRARSIRLVLWLVLALNLAVAFTKLGYGFKIGSTAMQADGFHSLFDGVSNVVGLLGMWLAARPPDASHPYGHGKFEAFTAAGIAVLLLIAAYSVGRGALASLAGTADPPQVTTLAFVVMAGTMVVNGAVTLVERRAGRRLDSEVLIADAAHTLSDVLVSAGVIVSLVLVAAGLTRADGVVALLVAVVILRTAYDVVRSAALTLGDAARLPADEIAAAVDAVPGVRGCHSVRTRGMQSQVYVDLHVLVDPGATVEAGHQVAHEVEERLRRRFTQVADVVVHVEPAHRVD